MLDCTLGSIICYSTIDTLFREHTDDKTPITDAKKQNFFYTEDDFIEKLFER